MWIQNLAKHCARRPSPHRARMEARHLQALPEAPREETEAEIMGVATYKDQSDSGPIESLQEIVARLEIMFQEMNR